MASFFYGNVFLEQVELLGIRKRAVQVGTQYVSTKCSISLRGLYNPAVNSFTFGQNSNAPLRLPSFVGPVTEAAIRNTLLQPRGQLVLEAAGFLIVVSPPSIKNIGPAVPATAQTGQALAAGVPAPAAGATPTGLALQAIAGLLGAITTTVKIFPGKFVAADANNGPVCDNVTVTQSVGDKTFIVEGTWTTWLVELPPRSGKVAPAVAFVGRTSRGGVSVGSFQQVTKQIAYPQSPLAAHEWEMVHVVDQDFFTTRIITGRTVFRRDILLANNLIPDQFRYWLSHPVPAGFRRQQIQVRAMPDGITFLYSITDRERRLLFDPHSFTRVEASWSAVMEQRGLMDALSSGRGGLASVVGNVLIGGNSGEALRRLGGAVGNLFQGNPGGALEDLQGAVGNLGSLAGIPVTNYSATARYWGHPNKNTSHLVNEAQTHFRNTLQNALTGIASIDQSLRLLFNANVQFLTTRSVTSRDVAGSFVELQNHIFGSILSGAWELAQRRLARISNTGQTNFVPAGRVINQPTLKENPMRGAYLGACVARALRNSWDNWDQPQDPDWIIDNETIRFLHRYTPDNYSTDGNGIAPVVSTTTDDTGTIQFSVRQGQDTP